MVPAFPVVLYLFCQIYFGLELLMNGNSVQKMCCYFIKLRQLRYTKLHFTLQGRTQRFHEDFSNFVAISATKLKVSLCR